MKDWIDITLEMTSDLPIWPESRGIRCEKSMNLDAGDTANVSHLDCDVHVGTHVETPKHFLHDGFTVEEISLDILIGPTLVAHLANVKRISSNELQALQIPESTRRLLLKTDNSELWRNRIHEFQKDYSALTADAAQWIADHNIALIGIDYLSIQRYEDSFETHKILMKAGVVIVEGLNLMHVTPGAYELFCLPIKLKGCEAAPARAILRPLSSR